MLHLLGCFLELHPHYSFIMNFCVFIGGVFEPKEGDFFSSVSISEYANHITELVAIESSFFFEFSFSCFFEGFLWFNTSFWEHESTFFVHDAEEFFYPPSLTYTYTTSTLIEPYVTSNMFFYFFKNFSMYHEFDCTLFSENQTICIL